MSELLEAQKPSGLPPQEVRLVTDNFRIEAQTDDRGLIDIPNLLQQVKSTIDASYDWPVDSTNVHHFYWPAAQYPNIQKHEEGINMSLFRNLPINKGLMPFQFHNWLHRVTIPPPLPDIEIVEYQMEAWDVTRSLFHSVKNARHWQRRVQRSKNNQRVVDYKDNVHDEIDIEVIEEIMGKHFVGVEECREKLGQVHPEFRLADPDEPFEKLVRTLGKIMAPSSTILVRSVVS